MQTIKTWNIFKIAKQLNLCQPHWVLFFSCFQFAMSYRPWSKNTKADFLSHVYPALPKELSKEFMFPKLCFVSTITWNYNPELSEANKRQVPLMQYRQDLCAITPQRQVGCGPTLLSLWVTPGFIKHISSSNISTDGPIWYRTSIN